MNRIGLGYDSHRFAAGRPLILGGVTIAHAQGLAGHSDADAVLHAITDALLGALGADDIGELFPDDDPKLQDADSSRFVEKVMQIVRAEGYHVANCDVTIITQQPKLKPYKEPMRQRIAELLGVHEGDVAVKAKTNEGMGWIGRGEGLATMAAVLLSKQ